MFLSRYTYDVKRLREWLNQAIKARPNAAIKPCSFMIGDIGDAVDWEYLMAHLWETTAKAWDNFRLISHFHPS